MASGFNSSPKTCCGLREACIPEALAVSVSLDVAARVFARFGEVLELDLRLDAEIGVCDWMGKISRKTRFFFIFFP